MKPVSFFLLFAVAFCLLFPVEVFACACCAEDGYYSISTKRPQKLELDELRKIRFGNANLYMSAAGENNIAGISPIGESYTLSGLLQNSRWKLNFKDSACKTGALDLLSPIYMVDYSADIHDGRTSGGGGPLLYKEWRFKYKVASGSGIFQKGVAPATEYFLVLQGRGNACPQAADFTDWRLEITGRKADYAFFGKLNSGKTAAN
ncbi:MAG TPA: hypothetical protein VNI84_10345 [Pyrinomonadaceae bacterium]|nr:hypothetical protein [Pyrinomonadaceae bacterium]